MQQIGKIGARHSRGVTLIELIVTLAIVVIIAGLAFPSYESYTRKTKRAVAKTALLEVRTRMENFMLNNKTYTDDLTDLGYGASPFSVDKQGKVVAAADGIYQIAVDAADATTYDISATAANTQANDTDCAVMRVDELGQKTAEDSGGTAAEKCW
jgi:type IV pilus assembly protein PilE